MLLTLRRYAAMSRLMFRWPCYTHAADAFRHILMPLMRHITSYAIHTMLIMRLPRDERCCHDATLSA